LAALIFLFPQMRYPLSAKTNSSRPRILPIAIFTLAVSFFALTACSKESSEPEAVVEIPTPTARAEVSVDDPTPVPTEVMLVTTTPGPTTSSDVEETPIDSEQPAVEISPVAEDHQSDNSGSVDSDPVPTVEVLTSPGPMGTLEQTPAPPDLLASPAPTAPTATPVPTQTPAPLPTEPVLINTPVPIENLAPDFTLPSIKGDEYTLSQFRGKQPVVIVFYRAYW
jgi:hypothetical protein